MGYSRFKQDFFLRRRRSSAASLGPRPPLANVADISDFGKINREAPVFRPGVKSDPAIPLGPSVPRGASTREKHVWMRSKPPARQAALDR